MTHPIPLRTKNGLPKHCYYEVDRHGKRRVRFRKGRVSAYLRAIPWSEPFMCQYAVALERLQAQASNVGAERVIAGTFDALCVSYYGSPDFRDLRPSTQRVRRNTIERLRRGWGKYSLRRDLERQDIQELMGRLHETPQSANNFLKVLRVLFAHAIKNEMMTSNPAIDIKRYSEGDGYPTWSEDDIATFEAAYPIGTRERLTCALTLYSAQRIGDVARMGWQHVKGDCIEVRQDKTSEPLLIPLHPKLARVLAKVPRDNLTFVLTDQGAPYTGARLSGWFSKRCRAAGLSRRTAHGLRKAACRRLAEAGCSANVIASISGHRSLNEIARYTRAADQARLAAQGLELQLRAERERKSSEPNPVRKDQG